MSKAIVASIMALAALGLVGGCLIVAGSGFTTSSKRGLWQVFVPAPQAYVMAGIMFAISGIAVLSLLRKIKVRVSVLIFCAAAYVGFAFAITRFLNQVLL
jgi:ABC-type cobalamin transport system permease subunit